YQPRTAHCSSCPATGSELEDEELLRRTEQGHYIHNGRYRAEIREVGSHCSPSREGSPIQLLAGLLTLVSSDWPPSRPAMPSPRLRRGRIAVSGILASPPRSQWRGRAGFSPASLLSFPKAPEANCSS